MNLLVLGILFIAAFILQYALTFVQMSSFKKVMQNLEEKEGLL